MGERVAWVEVDANPDGRNKGKDGRRKKQLQLVSGRRHHVMQATITECGQRTAYYMHCLCFYVEP